MNTVFLAALLCAAAPSSRSAGIPEFASSSLDMIELPGFAEQLPANFSGSFFGRDTRGPVGFENRKNRFTKKGPMESSPFIVNGVATNIAKFPHQVRIIARIREQGRVFTRFLYVCGGALITTTRVLTAANCKIPDAILYILMGVTDSSMSAILSDPNAQFIEVSRWRSHEGYVKGANPTLSDNDIAILDLAEPVKLNSFAKTIKLSQARAGWRNPESPRRLARRNICEISGFGADGDGNDDNDALLKSARILVMKNEVCSFEWKRVMEAIGVTGVNNWSIPRRRVCVVDRGLTTGPCYGDVGGPLTCVDRRGSARVVGLGSWRSSTCTPGVPAVYTRVSSYISWIQARIDT